jgi:phosphoglycolate phosphatase
VVCGDTAEHAKPHPAPVTLACAQIGVAPRDTLFVGDDPRDIESGHAAGVQTAAVFYGYGSRGLSGPLVENSFHVHRPSDLLPLLP